MNGSDRYPLDDAEWLDADLDRIANSADTDDDNDLIPDQFDQPPGRDHAGTRRDSDWRRGSLLPAGR